MLDFRLLLLADLSKLIAATAEPLDSFSACSVSSSFASGSQQNSHVRESRERPVGSRGKVDIDGDFGLKLLGERTAL
jgi:hypothetical protein